MSICKKKVYFLVLRILNNEHNSSKSIFMKENLCLPIKLHHVQTPNWIFFVDFIIIRANFPQMNISGRIALAIKRRVSIYNRIYNIIDFEDYRLTFLLIRLLP